MDAPPDREDSRPFVRVANYLEAIGLNAPHVIETDLDQGFLLLSDLGSAQYLETLTNDTASADRLYADAVAALVKLQAKGTAYQGSLPPYDAGFLRVELSLFKDWLCGTHLGIRFSDEEESGWATDLQGADCERNGAAAGLRPSRLSFAQPDGHRGRQSRHSRFSGRNGRRTDLRSRFIAQRLLHKSGRQTGSCPGRDSFMPVSIPRFSRRSTSRNSSDTSISWVFSVISRLRVFSAA